MDIQWTNSDGYYHVQLEKNIDKKDAIKQMISKILSLAEDKEDWNLIVLDKWIFNLGRLIGNIQNTDQAIGMDRGYRVAIQFLDYYDQLENSEPDKYDNNLKVINNEIERLICEVIEEEKFKVKLLAAHKLNPFSIEISEQGQRINFVLSVS